MKRNNTMDQAYDQLSFLNLVHWYRKELLLIQQGRRARDLLTVAALKALRKHNVITRSNNGKHRLTVLTERTRCIIES